MKKIGVFSFAESPERMSNLSHPAKKGIKIFTLDKKTIKFLELPKMNLFNKIKQQ